ncbi:MAG: AAA family ATPase [Saprospiraceae bacterium]
MDANKIRRLELSGFTCFSQIELDFSEGINVFIGENGVGKTHLMKVLYYAAYRKSDLQSNNFINIKLDQIFGIDGRQKLVRFGRFKEAKINTYFGPNDLLEPNSKGMEWETSFNTEPPLLDGVIESFSGSLEDGKVSLYIPVIEMLSWYEGFRALYERRELSFDSTYYTLAGALELPKLKGASFEKAQELALEIFQVIKADVFQKDGKFYFRFRHTEEVLEASVVAQGINKLGQLYYLILNGSLNKDTILFWDEPESGLNPKYIRLLANVLQTLANAGVQIFISTHDYLLAHQLSLMAEYRDTADVVVPDMKFFALYQTNEKEGTVAESGPTLADIQHNTILDEFSSFYDMEQGLFQQPVKQ